MMLVLVFEVVIHAFQCLQCGTLAQDIATTINSHDLSVIGINNSLTLNEKIVINE